MALVTGRSGERYVVYKLGESLREIAAQIIRLALEHNDWNVSKTAKALRMKRPALTARIKKLGFERPARGFPSQPSE